MIKSLAALPIFALLNTGSDAAVRETRLVTAHREP
jgi:hypothetical protein